MRWEIYESAFVARPQGAIGQDGSQIRRAVPRGAVGFGMWESDKARESPPPVYPNNYRSCLYNKAILLIWYEPWVAISAGFVLTVTD